MKCWEALVDHGDRFETLLGTTEGTAEETGAWNGFRKLLAKNLMRGTEYPTIVSIQHVTDGRQQGEIVFGLDTDGTYGNWVVHTRDRCPGVPCALHGPSDHPLARMPMRLCSAGTIERVCEHGKHHPDPDNEERRTQLGYTPQEHTCSCGCCTTKEIPMSVRKEGEHNAD